MARIWIFALLALLPLGAFAQPGTVFPDQDSGEPPASDYVVVCKIEGMIDDGVAVVVERAVQAGRNADAIVFVIDTPGGRVDSAITITKHIMSASCPTIAYIEGMGAISAGAIISYSCDHIVMAPASNIGASTPINVGAQDSNMQVTEKSMSFIRAKYRALGEENGHNPLLGEAMVDNEIELYGVLEDDGSYTVLKARGGKIVDRYTEDGVDDQPHAIPEEEEPAEGFASLRMQVDPGQLPELFREFLEEQEDVVDEEPATPILDSQGRTISVPPGADVISPEGKLLTLTSAEAVRYRLSPVQADNIDQALTYFGYPEMKKHYVIPSFAEILFAWLTSPMISGLLLMMGLGGLYLEVRTPGFGLPGIIGASCLAIFFGSYLVLGIADWADLLFVLIGICLIIAELFFIPGFGIPGIAGLVCLVVGFYLAMVKTPIPQYDWDFARLNDVAWTMTTAAGLLVALVAASWKLLPATPMGRWLILAESQENDAGYIVQTDEHERLSTGLTGVATSFLRPSGRGRFDGRNYDVVTRGEFIESGTPIKIVKVDGNRHVVEEDTSSKGEEA